MPWTDAQHNAAKHDITVELAVRRRQLGAKAVDGHPRVVESLALENTGNSRYPRTAGGQTGDRLRRTLRTGRYERWSTIVWRAVLADTLARSAQRVHRMTGGAGTTPIEAARAAGVPIPNRAARRAAAKRRNR